jgi:pyruvate formate lyase activating enzyme
MTRAVTALITNIQGFSIHDGPGIRTVIFLKGCPLDCEWCQNPECIGMQPEIGILQNLCRNCGRCVDVCPNNARVRDSDQPPRVDRARCSACGTCVSACHYEATTLYGTRMSVEQVFSRVIGDKMFYDASGGGVTASGGEPLLQSRFVCALFDECREHGISTCVETSGYSPASALRNVLSRTDFVLFDLKLLDSDEHRLHTGRPNRQILANARIVAASGVESLFRMPLIPGITDTPKNIRGLAEFLQSLPGSPPRVELMPYHRLGTNKYLTLDREYRLVGLETPTADDVGAVVAELENLGVSCSVSN